jgi:hypothetical protein
MFLKHIHEGRRLGWEVMRRQAVPRGAIEEWFVVAHALVEAAFGRESPQQLLWWERIIDGNDDTTLPVGRGFDGNVGSATRRIGYAMGALTELQLYVAAGEIRRPGTSAPVSHGERLQRRLAALKSSSDELRPKLVLASQVDAGDLPMEQLMYSPEIDAWFTFARTTVHEAVSPGSPVLKRWAEIDARLWEEAQNEIHEGRYKESLSALRRLDTKLEVLRDLAV